MSKLAVVTYASDPTHLGLIRLARTLSAWGWDFRPIIGEWRGFASKMNGVYAALPQLESEGYTHVLFTDAYDTVCCGTPDRMDGYLNSATYVSTEIACWPDPSKASEYPLLTAQTTRWKHVNSGGYVGPISSLKKILAGAEGDDQLWLTNKYLESVRGLGETIFRDVGCNVFQTLAHTVLPWSPWEYTFVKEADGRVMNRETGNRPVFFHGNGGDPKSIDWLNDHLKLGEASMDGMIDQRVVKAAPVTVPAGEFHWSQIGGFGDHDFANFYEKIVAEAPPNSTIVEVGCYHGRSLCHLALTAKAANKGLRIIGVEHGVDQGDGCIPIILGSLKKAGLLKDNASLVEVGGLSMTPLDDVMLIHASSVAAAKEFKDGAIWCVFLDDGHLHEEVEASIDAWMPKVAPNGILAGHDSQWFSVWEPVHAKLPGVIHDPMYRDCWWSKKQTPFTNVDIHASVRIQFEHGDAHFGYGVGDKRNDGKPSGSPFLA